MTTIEASPDKRDAVAASAVTVHGHRFRYDCEHGPLGPTRTLNVDEAARAFGTLDVWVARGPDGAWGVHVDATTTTRRPAAPGEAADAGWALVAAAALAEELNAGTERSASALAAESKGAASDVER